MQIIIAKSLSMNVLADSCIRVLLFDLLSSCSGLLLLRDYVILRGPLCKGD